jgi:hypothetical protein
LFVAASAQAQTPLSDADCEATWKAAGGTDLTPDTAKPFIASFDQVDVPQRRYQLGGIQGWLCERLGHEVAARTSRDSLNEYLVPVARRCPCW